MPILLSIDCLMEVFQFLDAIRVGKCKLVCKGWNKVLSSSQRLPRHVFSSFGMETNWRRLSKEPKLVMWPNLIRSKVTCPQLIKAARQLVGKDLLLWGANDQMDNVDGMNYRFTDTEIFYFVLVDKEKKIIALRCVSMMTYKSAARLLQFFLHLNGIFVKSGSIGRLNDRDQLNPAFLAVLSSLNIKIFFDELDLSPGTLERELMLSGAHFVQGAKRIDIFQYEVTDEEWYDYLQFIEKGSPVVSFESSSNRIDPDCLDTAIQYFRTTAKSLKAAIKSFHVSTCNADNYFPWPKACTRQEHPGQLRAQFPEGGEAVSPPEGYKLNNLEEIMRDGDKYGTHFLFTNVHSEEKFHLSLKVGVIYTASNQPQVNKFTFTFY